MRWFLVFCAMLFAMSGRALAEERETRIYVDGVEQELHFPLWLKDGTLFLSVEDFAACLQGEYQDLDQNRLLLHIGKPERMEEAVWLDQEFDLWIAKNKSPYWIGPQQGELGANGIWYLPLRETADALNVKVRWSREEKADIVEMNKPAMPRITTEAVYNKMAGTVTVRLENKEPQAFIYGDGYYLQKWDGQVWEEAPLVKEREYDGMAMTLPGEWQGDGVRTEAFRVDYFGEPLEAGKYRICIPMTCELKHFPFSKQTDADVQSTGSNPDFYTVFALEGQRSYTKYILNAAFEVK